MQNQQQREAQEEEEEEGGEVSRTGSVAYETRRRILLQHFHKVFPLKSFPLFFSFFFLSVASAVGFAKAFLPYALTATKDTRAKQAEREYRKQEKGKITGNLHKIQLSECCLRPAPSPFPSNSPSFLYFPAHYFPFCTLV